MKSFEGFKSEPPRKSFPQLPAGAYVCRIVAAREDGEYPDDSIILRLEIIEGEWAGYYTRRYKNDMERSVGGNFELRYKGDFRIRAPREENPHIGNLEWAVRAFNNAIWAIEDSNEGYHFDFNNIQALKGKTVGISVRNAQFQGMLYTEIGRLESVKEVRAGTVRPMRDKPDRSAPTGYSAPTSGGAADDMTQVELDELPF